jgi:formate-dependent nitrite reductase membrane component NrfD
MRSDTTLHSIKTGYLAKEITKAPNWHHLVVWDVLFNNLSTGLFLVAAVGELAFPRLLGGVAKAAYPVALVFLLFDLVLLVLDLGDPLRFHHMLRVFKPSSPMSLGVWSLNVYLLLLSLIVAIEAAKALELLSLESAALETVRRWAVILALFPAFASLAYKGVLFSTSAQPGWKDARWLGGFLANSALTLGCASMLTLAVARLDSSGAVRLRAVLMLLLPLGLIPAGLLFVELHRAFLQPSRGRHVYLALMAFGLVGGVLLPLILLFARPGAPRTLVAMVFILLGNLAVRWLIIKMPHFFHETGSGEGS